MDGYCTLVEGDKLKVRKDNIIDIVINCYDYTLIFGVVYSKDEDLCEGATVEVVEINPYTKERNMIGSSITDENGRYMLTVNPIAFMLYEFTAYSPYK